MGALKASVGYPRWAIKVVLPLIMMISREDRSQANPDLTDAMVRALFGVHEFSRCGHRPSTYPKIVPDRVFQERATTGGEAGAREPALQCGCAPEASRRSDSCATWSCRRSWPGDRRSPDWSCPCREAARFRTRSCSMARPACQEPEALVPARGLRAGW